MKTLALVLMLILAVAALPANAIDYSIYAIRYADSPGDAVSGMVMGAPEGEKVDTVYAFWLISGDDRNILVDSGFHHERWFELWTVQDFLSPDAALRLAGVEPGDVTDIIVSHAHWDHMGGIDLFPEATIWIQREEFRYYTGDAWQPDGDHGGIDPDDVAALVRANTRGRVRLVDGDDREIIPGIRVYTGARHTFASQYVLVGGDAPVILASDNVYLYRNLSDRAASATFTEADHAANVEAQQRMAALAGSLGRIVPGHDALQFQRYKTAGRVARIR